MFVENYFSRFLLCATMFNHVTECFLLASQYFSHVTDCFLLARQSMFLSC